MKNSKLIALLMTATAVFSTSAKFCYDKDGNRVSCSATVVTGAANVAGDTVEGAGDLAANILTFGGHSRRKEEKKQASKKYAEKRDEKHSDLEEEVDTEDESNKRKEYDNRRD